MKERCNLFCRTFLLCCQEMPASFCPLDKIRMELFKWHYWYDNDFPYFPDTPFSILCEDSCSALLTLPGNQIPRAHSSHGSLSDLRLVTTQRTSSLPAPILHLPLAPQLGSSENGGCTYAHGRQYPRACMQFSLGGCQDGICAQRSASQAAPGLWLQCGVSPVIPTMTYSFSVVSAP